MVKSSNKNNTIRNSDNQGIVGEGRITSTEMVVATMKTSGNKRVLDEDVGSIRVGNIDRPKRSKTSATQPHVEEIEHLQQRLDEPAQPPQREERIGVHLDRPKHENSTTMEYDEESHELAMAVALASLASGGMPSDGPSKAVKNSGVAADEAAEIATNEKIREATNSDLSASSSKSSVQSKSAESTGKIEDTSSSNTFGPAPVTPEKIRPSGATASGRSLEEEEEFNAGDDSVEDEGDTQDSKAQCRRVHFAPGVKPDGSGRRRPPQSRHHHQHNFIPTLGARAVARRQVPSSRAFRMVPAFPPNHPQRWMMPPSSALPYPREETPVVWQPPPTIRRISSGVSPSTVEDRGSTGNVAISENKWICDFCHVASFETFQAACDHEHICPWRRPSSSEAKNASSRAVATPPPAKSSQNDSQSEVPNEMESSPKVRSQERTDDTGSKVKQNSMDRGQLLSTKERDGHAGSAPMNSSSESSIVRFPMAVPERDAKWLDETQCMIREKCVEIVCDPTHAGRVSVHCQFCRGNVTPGGGRVGHVTGLFDVVMQGWAKYHYPCCPAAKGGTIPSDINTKLAKRFSQQQSITLAAEGDIQTRHYWIGAAQALGLMNTPSGVQLSYRFGASMPGRDASMSAKSSPLPLTKVQLAILDQFMDHGPASPQVGRIVTMRTRTPNTHVLHPHHTVAYQHPPQPSDRAGRYLVFADDAEMVPPYVYFLLRQVETCYFSEADRFVARSKGPIGFAGFQCRHCHGHAGLGKYFPVSSKSLSTNSTSQNVHAHLLKCRHCPPAVKQELLALKEEKSRAPRLEPGWRKVFFDKIWARLHQKSTQIPETTKGTQKGASPPVEK